MCSTLPEWNYSTSKEQSCRSHASHFHDKVFHLLSEKNPIGGLFQFSRTRQQVMLTLTNTGLILKLTLLSNQNEEYIFPGTLKILYIYVFTGRSQSHSLQEKTYCKWLLMVFLMFLSLKNKEVSWISPEVKTDLWRGCGGGVHFIKLLSL